MSLTFLKLKSNYPVKPRAKLYRELGGEWPDLVDDLNYANTCAIRLSIALIKSGVSIPGQYREAMTGDGKKLILKVSTMGAFFSATFGDAYWGMSKQPGQALDLTTLVPGKGVLVYHAQWSNASGHFDLWDGSKFVGNGNASDVKDGYSLAFWPLE